MTREDGTMVEPIGIEPGDIEEAKRYETLGPVYYSARRMAEALMQNADTSPFHEVATKAADEVRQKLYDYVETHLLGDLEINIQGHVCRMVDDTVRALLTGQEWAMRRYPYHAYSRGEEVRAAVARHGGEPLLVKRIEDLEKEIARLKQSLEWARDTRY